MKKKFKLLLGLGSCLALVPTVGVIYNVANHSLIENQTRANDVKLKDTIIVAQDDQEFNYPDPTATVSSLDKTKVDEYVLKLINRGSIFGGNIADGGTFADITAKEVSISVLSREGDLIHLEVVLSGSAVVKNGVTTGQQPLKVNIYIKVNTTEVADTGTPFWLWIIIAVVIVIVAAVVAFLVWYFVFKKKKDAQKNKKVLNAKGPANGPGAKLALPNSGAMGPNGKPGPMGPGAKPGPMGPNGKPPVPGARPGAGAQKPGMQRPGSAPLPPKISVNAPPKSLAPKRK